jgi:formate dehydrogenase subunit delta
MTTQSHDSSAALVKMANDIADYFQSEKDRQLAVDGIVNHITRFWEPRMRKKILTHYAEQCGEGLNELARAAIAKLAEDRRASA